MAKKVNNGSNSDNFGKNIDQIREIILGPYARDVNERFKKLNSFIEEISKESKESLIKARDELLREHKNANEILEKKLKNLATFFRDERNALKEQIKQVDKRLTLSVDSINEENETRFNQLKNELHNIHKETKRELNELREHIDRELERGISQLTANKVSKDDMADILFDIAMRIQGGWGNSINLDTTNENNEEKPLDKNLDE